MFDEVVNPKMYDEQLINLDHPIESNKKENKIYNERKLVYPYTCKIKNNECILIISYTEYNHILTSRSVLGKSNNKCCTP